MFIRIVAILLFLCSCTLRAQTVGTPDGDTVVNKKKTIKVSVIDPKGKKRITYDGTPMRFDSVQKAVKIDPSLFLRGEYSLFFEWRLSNHFSVEGAAGLTYIDFMYELFQNNGRFVLAGLERSKVQFHTGVAVRAQARYFPSRYETAIEGFYIAPSFAYRTWNMEYYVSNGLVAIPYDVKRQWTEFRIQLGEQDPDPYSVVFTEWYLNLGIQFRDEDRVRGQGVTAELRHGTETRIVFGAGVKIGFVL